MLVREVKSPLPSTLGSAFRSWKSFSEHMRFRNRAEAGRRLAAQLTAYDGLADAIVLGLPRGGVPVAVEVARALHATLDVFVVRKLGTPGHPELAMGAIASGGVRVLSQDIIDELGIKASAIDAVTARERIELERRDRLYRGDRQLPDLHDRTVFVVDDGLATGATMEAAVRAVRLYGPARVVVATPVGAVEACQRLRRVADEVVCTETPEPFRAVGLWYEQFEPTTDEEVISLMRG
jgi:putative phosphoribosyl transferase